MAAKSITATGCWIALSIKPYSNGYTVVRSGHDKRWLAHRLMYSMLIGPLIDGMEIDHVCRNRRCFNPHPDHLEQVTHAVNNLRGESTSSINAKKTLCPRGHQLSGDNLYFRPKSTARNCRTCRRAHKKSNPTKPRTPQQKVLRSESDKKARRNHQPATYTAKHQSREGKKS